MLNRKEWHKSLTPDVIMDACDRHMTCLDDPGFCLVCGNEQGGCEPDARNYRCENCGAAQVFGCEELMLEVA